MTAERVKILVTGASGFIGGACLRALARRGLSATAISTRVMPPGGPAVAWICADLLDHATLHRLMCEIRPTHLLHVAWYSTPPTFWSNPNNLRWLSASAALFHAFGSVRGRRAVGVGTCAEYPVDSRSNGVQQAPATIYGKTKLAAGLALQAAAQAHDFSAAWARLFYPYGPGEPTQKLIGSVINGLLHHQRVACTDGSQIRDMVYIDDVGEALVALLLDDAPGVFDIGTGLGTSIRSFIELICTKMGASPTDIDFGARPFPSHESRHLVAHPDRLPKVSVWRPLVGIEDGIARTIAANQAARLQDRNLP